MKVFEIYEFYVKTLEEAKAIVDFGIKNQYMEKEEEEDTLEELSLGGWNILLTKITPYDVDFIKRNLIKNHPIK